MSNKSTLRSTNNCQLAAIYCKIFEEGLAQLLTEIVFKLLIKH